MIFDEDNDEKINRLVEEEVVKEFENDFSPKFKEDVQNDLECLLAIQNLEGHKFNQKVRLISILKNNKILK